MRVTRPISTPAIDTGAPTFRSPMLSNFAVTIVVRRARQVQPAAGGLRGQESQRRKAEQHEGPGSQIQRASTCA